MIRAQIQNHIGAIFQAVGILLVATSVAYAETPETVIPISIYDLIAKPVKPAIPKVVKRVRNKNTGDVIATTAAAPIPSPTLLPSLPEDYASRVAHLIEESRSTLEPCLDLYEDSSSAADAEIKILITPSGSATVQLPAQEAAKSRPLECVARLLSTIEYPKHALEGPVAVKLPLHLRREKL